MKHMDRAQLAALARLDAAPCVSIFLPVDGGGTANRQDPVRLQNLMRQAAVELARLGFDEEGARAVLAPVEELAAEPTFWSAPAGGLALYSALGFLRTVRVDYTLPERVVIGDHFSIRPLLPLLERVKLFYVLAVSLNRVRLLEVTPEGVDELRLAGMPASFEAEMGYAQYDSGVQVHATAAPGLGRSGMFHGHGDGDEERYKEDVVAYFRRIVSVLERHLPGQDTAIVLAAVAPHHALFARANRRLRVTSDGIFGNPDATSNGELAERGRDIVQEERSQHLDTELSRWVELRGNGRGVDDFEEIVRAADQGRIEALFLAEGAERWGSYERDLCRVAIHSDPEPGDVDLLELSAARTLAQGGCVYTLPQGLMPQGRALVATLRYAVAA